ncbi:MAG TPA: 1,4-alpha-glucan branching protein GlgB [Acidobacteriota bacterium]|nr:1,4-alpha-glucan branching protein GlgB [Acidobacteriota bacterium]
MTGKRQAVHGASLLSEQDIYLFKQGTHYRLYERLGAHVIEHEGRKGTLFAVWAPNATEVSVVGDFNYWTPGERPMSLRWDESGIWECFIPEVGNGALYKYHIVSPHTPGGVAKGDPFAFHWEAPPHTASVVWDLDYEWDDEEWLKTRPLNNGPHAPMSIYEIHAGSWRRVPHDDNRSLSYEEMSDYLCEYLRDTGFTHVEFLPLTEHPFTGSWGYQTVGYFAPTSRYGTPQQFMKVVDKLHQNGVGVMLDWVPSHFPTDEHGLGYYDGTHLFEHADPRLGFHPDWQSYIFNYARNEVRSFLISSALFWLDRYHIDGLRVDAVASMLYLDYSREEGEWIPNSYGGRENLEAISLLQEFNRIVHKFYPSVLTVAEESTAWPKVTWPADEGGLGFDMKWKMGWMHDTLHYFKKDPVYRKWEHDKLTFSMWYAYTEKYVLPLSHDEVVHMKGSLINKMPGDGWQKFANLRLLYGHMYSHPGKKLLFMGAELGQWREWNHDSSLDWHLLESAPHQGLWKFMQKLNKLYRQEPALFERDFEPAGFEWIDLEDRDRSIVAYLRRSNRPSETILVVCNFTPVVHESYRLGVPEAGTWKEILNSDAKKFGGSGVVNSDPRPSEAVECHNQPNSILFRLPPLGVVFLKKEK